MAEYTYESAGLDSFLSRSIDNLNQVNLDGQGPVSTAVRFDSAQVTGSLGNVLSVGKIKIDGVKGRISFFDDNGTEYMRQGELDD